MNQVQVKLDSLARSAPQTSTQAYAHVKRVLDIFFSLCLLMLALPLFIVIALIVVIDSPGPVFFLQTRLGRGGRTFGLVKFRTIRRAPTDGDIQGTHTALNGADPDITRIGHFLRSSGLNELPQLINILRGEMSFIGPRPAVLAHEAYYTDWHRKRLDVAPGVTGLAQVCGRNLIPWGWRIALDRYYVERMGLGLDFSILIKTLFVVLFGIGTEGHESLYFDFTPPDDSVLNALRRRGVWRCFLRAEAARPDGENA
jgi:undecaprenyl phosphate N,N'-diacetylbacillosamine 1-phosphate transferase